MTHLCPDVLLQREGSRDEVDRVARTPQRLPRMTGGAEQPVSLSAVGLTANAPFRRELPNGAQPPEGDAFDGVTMIHDVFRSPDGSEIILIGPPPVRLERWLLDAVGRAFPADSEIRWFAGDRHCKIRIRSDARAVEFDESYLAPRRLAVQPNMCDRFAGRRVLFTLSKDNRLDWIADWATFHASGHGCDAVLLYDNASTLYGREALSRTLEAVPGIEVVTVVEWPYSYGVQGASNFCQFTMLEHARRRFLARARSVVNADIDELPVTRDGRSIFELAEQSTTGYVRAAGRYVGNATRSAQETRRHRDFLHRDRDDPPSMPKWAAVPDRCPDSAVWRVHRIGGMTPDPIAASGLVFYHFKAINNNWREARWQPGVGINADSVVEEELAAWMTRIAWQDG